MNTDKGGLVREPSGSLTLKQSILKLCYDAKASHIGSALSCCDIIDVLYTKSMKADDIFILSKGHAVAALYAVLARAGKLEDGRLDTYCRPEGLPCHPSSFTCGAILHSSGSLGHGLGVGCGIAIARQLGDKQGRVFVLCGDGELDEGSMWEAILFAAHHKLSNLVLLVDHNHLQSFGSESEVLDLSPLAAKLKAFNWVVSEISEKELSIMPELLTSSFTRPMAIIVNTTKGSGVSFMENRLEWHYKTMTEAEYKKAYEELGDG